MENPSNQTFEFLEATEALNSALVGKELTKLFVYNVSDDYFQLKEFNELAVDGGIELLLGEELFCLAWNDERELFDYRFGPIQTLSGEQDIWKIDLEGFDEAHSYIGKKITEVQIDWNWFFDLDEEFQPVETPTPIPKQLVIVLENGMKIQIVPSMFTIENDQLKEAYFNSQARLLVNFKDIIVISEYEG